MSTPTSPLPVNFRSLRGDLTFEERGLLSLRSVFLALKVFGVLLLLLAAACGALIPAGLLLVIVGVTWLQSLRARQRVLGFTLRTALRHGMPLDPVLRDHAIENGGWFYWDNIAQLRLLLLSGCPLGDALDRVMFLLPARTILLIRCAEATGRLRDAVDSMDQMNDRPSPNDAELVYRMSYLVLFGFIASGLLIFTMVWVVPRFQAIFDDFDTDLPVATQHLIAFAHGLATYWPLPMGILILVAGVWCLAHMLLCVVWEKSPVLWPPLGFQWVLRSSNTACVLRACSLFIDANRPIGEGLAMLARRFPYPAARRRLRRVARDVEAGQPWIESLRRRGLVPRAEAAVLEAAQRAGNLSWALRAMAGGMARRSFYRMALWSQIGFVGCVLTVGLGVGFYMVAMFLPLVKLISQLAV